MRCLSLLLLAILLCPPKALCAELRNWTDITGKFQTKAKYLGFKNGIVRLEKVGGGVAAIPIAKLSLPDRLFARNQEASEATKLYLVEAERQRFKAIKRIRVLIAEPQKEIIELHAQIKLLKRGKNPFPPDESGMEYTPKGFDLTKRAHRTKYIKHLQTQIKEREGHKDLRKKQKVLETIDPPPIPMLWPLRQDTLGVGKAGVVMQMLEVMQVIDKNNMLVAAADRVLSRFGGGTERAPTFWLGGVSTAQIADGHKFRPEVVMVITGTKQYITVAGATKTVFFAEVIDLKSQGLLSLQLRELYGTVLAHDFR